MFEDVEKGAGCINRAFELVEAGGNIVCMVVVIVCDEQAFEPAQLACFLKFDDLAEYPPVAAVVIAWIAESPLCPMSREG